MGGNLHLFPDAELRPVAVEFVANRQRDIAAPRAEDQGAEEGKDAVRQLPLDRGRQSCTGELVFRDLEGLEGVEATFLGLVVEAAQELTIQGEISGGLALVILTDADSSEILRMIGHGAPVEGRVGGRILTADPAVLVDPRHVHFAFGESISVARRGRHEIDAGVERPLGVDVGRAEEGLLERIVVGAGLDVFGALERKLGRGLRGGGSRQQGDA